jgi:hypothetical protein
MSCNVTDAAPIHSNHLPRKGKSRPGIRGMKARLLGWTAGPATLTPLVPSPDDLSSSKSQNQCESYRHSQGNACRLPKSTFVCKRRLRESKVWCVWDRIVRCQRRAFGLTETIAQYRSRWLRHIFKCGPRGYVGPTRPMQVSYDAGRRLVLFIERFVTVVEFETGGVQRRDCLKPPPVSSRILTTIFSCTHRNFVVGSTVRSVQSRSSETTC